MSQAEQTPSRSGQRMLRMGCALACVVLMSFGMVMFLEEPSSLPSEPVGEVPDFTLTERNGQDIHKNDLLGKVWIADLIYTQCTTECPLLSSRMAQLQEAFSQDEDVALVSITVDPEHDTPVVLQHYAERYGAHPTRWLFLTGTKAAIYRLTREGFRLGVREPEKSARSSRSSRAKSRRRWALAILAPTVAWAHHDGSPATGPSLLHSNRLVLIGQRGHIWAYYDSTEQTSMRALQRDVRTLLHTR